MGAGVARVAGFNLTPVKSTGLSRPHRVLLEPRGVRGNREFVFVQSDGLRLSGVSKAPLMGIRSRYDPDGDRLTLRLPDGTTIADDATPGEESLEVEFYGGVVLPVRPLASTALREAALGLLHRHVRLGRLADPTRDTVGEPVSLLSRSSVRELERRSATTIDARRFRMLIELEDTEPFEEESWLGRTFTAGDVELLVTRPVSRCVMTTLHPDTGEQDRPTLAILADHKGRTDEGVTLGVYATVVRAGTLSVGDGLYSR